MDAIESYLENMFARMPQSAEVLRAKRDLLEMMEDKYNELKAAGRSENEAVGAVITEFGNLDELAESLGISTQVNQATEEEHFRMTDAEVDKYLNETALVSRKIALGVALCVLSVAPLLLLLMFAEAGWMNEKVATAIGVASIFILVALGIYHFIVYGIRTEKYEKLEWVNVALDPRMKQRISRLKEDFQPSFARSIATGVILILVGVIVLVMAGILEVQPEYWLLLTVVLLLVLISIAVSMFVNGGMRSGAYDKLLNEGDYSPRHKKSNSIAQTISGPYWLVVVLIYLAWSFITFDWSFTWIVWPIAGILYGIIAGIIGMIQNN